MHDPTEPPVHSAVEPSPPRAPLSRLRRAVRRGFYRLEGRTPPAGDTPLPDLRSLRRILLVSVNNRLGNEILTTAALAPLVRALPDAELDYVGGPLAREVVAGYGLRRVFTVERRDALLPWRTRAIVRALRAERYDAAIHLSTATGSMGARLVGDSGAPHRIGCRRTGGNLFFTTEVEPPKARHKVDQLLEYVGALGIPAADGERELVLEPEEQAWATRFLKERLGAGHPAAVGIFLSGRERKGRAWSLQSFGRVAEGLRSHGLRPVVFLGPEERAMAAEIRTQLGQAVFVEEPLRKVMAIVSRCAAAVSGDSGPMHLAIAAGTPTVAVFRFEDWDKRGPRPPRGEVVYDPAGDDATAVVDALLRYCRPNPSDAALRPEGTQSGGGALPSA